MKELSNGCAIVDVFPSTKTVTIPVTMGGAPNEVVVQVGDVVKRGQVIARSDKFMSAPVHASISGKVKKIQSFMVTGGAEVPCITIESDGSSETDFMPPLDPFACSKQEALARIKDAGIVGMGGASFPAHVKLNPPADKKIDFVLLNAAECEPYLTVDERTLLELTDKVVDGFKIVSKIIGAKGIMVLEENKKYIAPKLKDAIKAKGWEKDIGVAIVKTKYPQGCEKNIVEAVMGVQIPAACLPADAGAVITNVGTVCAISDAFRLGMPLIDRALTISGGAVEKPCNIRVPVGTVLGDLIGDVFNLKKDETAKIISGGPMMGFAMPSTQFPIAKGTSGVTFLTKKETYLVDESPCLNCGKCVDACPMGLVPGQIVRSLEIDDMDAAKKYGLMDCIECGCCAYVCPSNVRLVQQIRLGKGKVRAQMAAERAKAEAAKKAAEEKSGGEAK